MGKSTFTGALLAAGLLAWTAPAHAGDTFRLDMSGNTTAPTLTLKGDDTGADTIAVRGRGGHGGHHGGGHHAGHHHGGHHHAGHHHAGHHHRGYHHGGYRGYGYGYRGYGYGGYRGYGYRGYGYGSFYRPYYGYG